MDESQDTLTHTSVTSKDIGRTQQSTFFSGVEVEFDGIVGLNF
jgi:hypothetical protein